jgi:citrate synthase
MTVGSWSGAVTTAASLFDTQAGLRPGDIAIAAALGDCGVPAGIMRGFALISRCAGLVGHIHEERQKPALRAIREAADGAVPYDGEAGG